MPGFSPNTPKEHRDHHFPEFRKVGADFLTNVYKILAKCRKGEARGQAGVLAVINEVSIKNNNTMLQKSTPKNQPGQSFSSISVNPSSWFAPCTAQGARGVALADQSSLPEPNPHQNPGIFPKPAPPLLLSHLFPASPCPKSTKTAEAAAAEQRETENSYSGTMTDPPNHSATKILLQCSPVLLQAESRNSTVWGSQHPGTG